MKENTDSAANEFARGHHNLNIDPRLTPSPTRLGEANETDNGVDYHLGEFDTEEEAARAYDNWAYWFGEEGYKCRRLNFPEEYRGTTKPPLPNEATARSLVDLLTRRLDLSNHCPKRLQELARLCPAFSNLLAAVTESARKRRIALGLPAD